MLSVFASCYQSLLISYCSLLLFLVLSIKYVCLHLAGYTTGVVGVVLGGEFILLLLIGVMAAGC